MDYHVYKTDGEMIDVRSPQDLPEATRIERIEEPYLKAKIICRPSIRVPSCSSLSSTAALQLT